MIELSDIQKRYELGGEVLMALDHVDLTVGDHEYVAIIGPSGSGKSTLMNIIGCLDTADGGTYKLDGLDITRYSQRQLAAIRGSARRSAGCAWAKRWSAWASVRACTIGPTSFPAGSSSASPWRGRS